MKVRLIGDVHGKFGKYRSILTRTPYPTIQVGDMGVGFFQWPHGEPSVNPPYDKMVEGGHRFIRGNHDNPAVCKRHTQFIPDGTVEGTTMFIGGAVSIDKAFRVEGFSWWPDEELSYQELDALVQKYIEVKPETMITHECPEEMAEALIQAQALFTGKKSGMKLEPEWSSRTRQAFQQMWSAHSPKLWVFGHWHYPFDHVLRGTRFVCLGELQTMDVDL